ncbi:MAG: FAD-binding oxidoreductase [Thermaerobacter sp.]
MSASATAPASAEIVIIGGGVHGAAAAYYLARDGRDVVLFEKGDLAGGATGLSVGLIRCHYSNEPMIRLAHRAAVKWQDLESELGQSLGYRRNGLIVAVAPDDADALRRNVELQRRIGVDTELMAPEEISRYVPGFRAHGLALAAFERQAAVADPHRTATAFAARAQELGARVYTGTAVTAIRLRDGRVEGVETDRGFVRCEWVIHAAGAWAPRLAAGIGVDLPVKPGSLSVCAFDPRYEGWSTETPTWMDLDTVTYARPDARGLIIAGSDHDQKGDEDDGEAGALNRSAPAEPDPDVYHGAPDDLTAALVYERIVDRCPWAEGARLVRGWIGVDAYTPDYHLIFAEAPAGSRCLHVTGGSGNSFKLSPAVGEAVAEYVASGSCTYLDTQAFSLERFATGRLFRGAYRMHILG